MDLFSQVAHMTRSEMEYLDWVLLGPALLFFNQYFNTFFSEYWVLWTCLVGLDPRLCCSTPFSHLRQALNMSIDVADLGHLGFDPLLSVHLFGDSAIVGRRDLPHRPKAISA